MHSSPRPAPTFVMAKLRAYYRPLGDYVNLPHFDTFTKPAPTTASPFTNLAIGQAEKRLARTFGKTIWRPILFAPKSLSPN